jgi:transcription termination factor Rho
MLSSMSEEEGLKLILNKMKETNTNEDFLALIDLQQ